ncbi:hypothetical protein [Ramlibacter sp.]|uniref:hypothetical protein n=1 Tax=Ramlibacter sp. TaxID=1917967 RepID=UPI003D0CA999
MGAYFGTRAKPRIITIVVRDGNHFDVHEGEKYSDRLCWEEMLGQVVTLTHSSIKAPRFWMATPEEHSARREHGRRNWITPVSRELGPMTVESLTLFVREHGRRGGDGDELLAWAEQDDARVRLAMMLLNALKPLTADVVDAEVRS